MLAPLLGYFFCMITMLTAVVVVLTGLSNISTSKQERHHLRPPVIGRTVTAEEPAQRPSPVAKEASPAKDASPAAKEASPAKDVSSFVATAKADTKKASITNPKCSLTNPKCSPVSATTTAMGTRWVMPKNMGTDQGVFFSSDPAHG